MLVPKTYDLLDRCVRDGIELGYRRAHKHDSDPSGYAIGEHIHREVMSEICDWFNIKEFSIDKNARRNKIEKAIEDAFKDGVDLSGKNTP